MTKFPYPSSVPSSESNPKKTRPGASNNRIILVALIVLVALSVVASSAASSGRLQSVIASVNPSIIGKTAGAEAPPSNIPLTAPQKGWLVSRFASQALAHPPAFAPLMLPQAPAIENVATFAADCTTPLTQFSLGGTVCAKVTNAPIHPDGSTTRRLVFIHPDGFVVDTADVAGGTLSRSFTLPSTETSTFAGLSIDNRGPWALATVDTEGGSRTVIGFTVHDPQRQLTDLQISKVEVTGLPVAGQPFSFIINIYNQGPDTAQNVRFSDSTPANTTFVSLTQQSGPNFTCLTPSVGSPGTSTCSGGVLPIGQSARFLAVYTVSAAVGNGAEVSDTISVASDTLERRASDNSSSTTASASNPTPPSCTINCPGNITVAAASGQSGATVTFDAAEPSGDCGAITANPTSGSFFSIGTEVVTVMTASGQSCSFTVTVTGAADAEAPVISCPADITVPESSSSSNQATVTYSVTATDNNGTPSVTCTSLSGSSFNVGTTEVVCTATDAVGNSSTCEFDVEVTEVACVLGTTAPTPDVASLPTITRTCAALLVASDIPSATDACGAKINGHTDDPLTYQSAGDHTINWTYTDSAGNTATQTQLVTVIADALAPVPNASSLPAVTGECSVTLTPPTALDNCAGDVNGTTESLTLTTPGTHTVVWTFTDASGNTATQNQMVTVTDTAAPSIALNGAGSITVECHASFTDPGVSATDNCDADPQITTTGSADPNTPGTYTITYTAKDDNNNTSSEVQRTVVVVDTTAPAIALNGASSMTVECHASFTDPGATAADTCDTSVPVTVTGSVNANVPGTYTLTYSAIDDSGNPATSLTRTVNVVDTTAPVISCPGNVVVSLPANGTATSMAVGFAVTATESCSSATVVSSHAPGSIFPVGTTTVTSTATDAAGNQSGPCAFTVTVLYDFTGFSSPVNNEPTVNNVNAGRAIPLKFSLSGNKGLNIFAALSPASQQVACNSAAPLAELEGTESSGGSTLTYSPDQYHYNWKTENGWVGTCRQLVITLNDGSVHTALFKFK